MKLTNNHTSIIDHHLTKKKLCFTAFAIAIPTNIVTSTFNIRNYLSKNRRTNNAIETWKIANTKRNFEIKMPCLFWRVINTTGWLVPCMWRVGPPSLPRCKLGRWWRETVSVSLVSSDSAISGLSILFCNFLFCYLVTASVILVTFFLYCWWHEAVDLGPMGDILILSSDWHEWVVIHVSHQCYGP